MSHYSSSEDEPNVESNFDIPTVNLANLRKKEGKNMAKANLVKAKKRLAPGSSKTVRFPDSKEYQMAYAGDVAPDEQDSDLDLDTQKRDSSLPDFTFSAPAGGPSRDLDSGSDSEGSNIDNSDMAHAVNTYNDDSSDDEPLRQDTPNPPPASSEMDITDIRPRTSSSSSERPSKSTFGDVFRRLSLAEHVQSTDAPSKSDTFLGKILNFSNGNSNSLSGGGLTPGGLHRDIDPIDEEKEVGMRNDQPIEMKHLDFAELGEEAQNLIYSHAPDLHDYNYQQSLGSGYDSRNESTAFLIENEKPAGRSEPKPPLQEPSGDQFYHPNPDLLNEDLEQDLNDDDYFEQDGYVAPPRKVHAGVLSSLLKLYQNPAENKSSSTFKSSLAGTLADEQYDYEQESRHTTLQDFLQLKNKMKLGPKRLAGKIYPRHEAKSAPSSELQSADDDDKEGLLGEAANLPSFQNAKPKAPKVAKADPRKLGRKLKKRDQQLRITVHIADILQRQRFIIRMCRALMLYGAPTHRLEEYMVMTSRVLEIDGQFVYFPGTMIVAFGDAATRTSEVHLVRCAQGLNLSKLADTHKIYKDVIHDLTGVEEAAIKLEELLKSKNIYSPWICVFLFGLGAASVCTWGFDGGWYDVPIAFAVGLIIGYLQFFMSSKSHLYSSVFEVTASIVVSFIARGIGSIKGGKYFCFGAIAQGSLALILPGYIILCGSLELQSKNLVAGSVRMFYAIIYSLFLGFGITLGAALYGWVDLNATDAATCPTGHAINDFWRMLFVPLFSICLGLINQARFNQLPVMTLITAVSYTATYFAGKHFSNVTEFTAAIGAFIIGILGNMYSRVGKGVAVSAMLPAIFVQVPSGIASKSTLLAGVNTANQITNSSSSTSSSSDLSSLSFGATMVEVSIGISVGLFAAAIVVYPFGKRKSGLFAL